MLLGQATLLRNTVQQSPSVTGAVTRHILLEQVTLLPNTVQQSTSVTSSAKEVHIVGAGNTTAQHCEAVCAFCYGHS